MTAAHDQRTTPAVLDEARLAPAVREYRHSQSQQWQQLLADAEAWCARMEREAYHRDRAARDETLTALASASQARCKTCRPLVTLRRGRVQLVHAGHCPRHRAASSRAAS